MVIQTVNEKEQPHPITFNLAPLTIAEELQLNNELKAMIENDRKVRRDTQLQEVSALPPSWAVGKYIEKIFDHVSDEVSQYEVNSKRITMEGTHVELWHRAKKTQPALRREEVQACVTVANWENVWEQMKKVITPVNPETPHKS